MGFSMVNETENKTGWFCCEKCGKKLLRRKANGVFVFKFGRHKKEGGDVVHIEIFGSIKIKCFRENCQHVNTIDFFPN